MTHTTKRARRSVAVVLGAALSLSLLPAAPGFADVQIRSVDDGCPTQRVPDSGFTDIEGNTHERTIECVAWYGVAQGKSSTTYAPQEIVSREQMASFLVRLLREGDVDLPANPPDAFDDDESSTHEHNINILADLGIAQGTRDTDDVDRDGDRQELIYEPRASVRRDQMASFINRSHGEITGSQLASSEDFFTDDNGNPHESNINGLAGAGIAGGTGGTTYEPANFVTRAAMASFLARDIDLLVELGFVTPPVEGLFDVVLDTNTVKQGRQLQGEVVTEGNLEVERLVVSGCGLSNQDIAVQNDGSISFAIPANQPTGPCDLDFTATMSDGRQDSEVLSVTVTQSDTVSEGPELVDVTVQTLGTSEVVVRYSFDEPILSAVEAALFRLRGFDASLYEAVGAERVRNNANAVDATFRRTAYDQSTTATVAFSAVQDGDGVFNPEGSFGVQDQDLDAGETSQPDLLSVTPGGGGSSSYTFRFDQPAYNSADFALDDFHIVLQNGNEATVTNVSGNNGSTVRIVTIDAASTEGSPAVRGWVEAGTLKAVDPASEDAGSETNAAQAADIVENQGDAPVLTSIRLFPNENQVHYTFSEAVSVSSTANKPNDMECLPGGLPNPPGADCQSNDTHHFHVYYVDGRVSTSEGLYQNGSSAGLSSRTVVITFPAGVVNDTVVGGTVDPDAVQEQAEGEVAKNDFTEVGVAQQFVEAETAAPDLLTVTRTVTGEEGAREIVITFTYDADVRERAASTDDPFSFPGAHYLYRADGRRTNLEDPDGDGDTTDDGLCTASEREVICRIAEGGDHFETAQQAVLGAVSLDAVRDSGGSFRNYATSQRL